MAQCPSYHADMYFAAQDDCAEGACRKHALSCGVSPEEAELCDDGEGLPCAASCPFRPKEEGQGGR